MNALHEKFDHILRNGVRSLILLFMRDSISHI